MDRAFYLLLIFLSACGHHSAMKSLLSHEISPDRPFCEDVPAIGPSGLSAALQPFKEPMEQGKTGVYVLEDGAGALVARGWLTDNAQKTVDAQYFIFAADNVGLLSTERLLLAAERGVQVRLLVDDLLAHGDAQVLLAVSQHPNLQVKIYNPNINIGKSLGEKLKTSLSDFRGVNQRMHNKTFIVDGNLVITGGRNVGDEYYDFDPVYNFRDRDVLLMGGKSAEVQTSFDEFWESPLSVPLENILEDNLPVGKEVVWKKLHQYACDPARYLPSFRERVNNAPQKFAELAGQGKLLWVDDVSYISDDPGKNEEESSLGGGGKSTTALIELVKNAKKSIVMQTPYLVVTELGLGLFAEAEARGVQIRITTNSLAATDGIAAFSGYHSVRPKLLKTGVDLYEFRPDAEIRKEMMTGPPLYNATYGLHAKTMVVDEEILMIGTFNLDPRSANLNTEGVAIIRDPLLAKITHDQIVREMSPENAWPSTPGKYPDKHAGFGARLKVILSKIVPKSVL